MQQILFRIPIGQEGIPVYGFGMMLFVAFIACIWITTRRARLEGISREFIQDLALWVFLGGLLGARITFLIFHDKSISSVGEFLVRLPRIWDAGLIFYGSVVGAVAAYFVGYYFFFRKKGISTLRLADAVAPSIALGLLFGRIGCLLNGCCYGQPSCPTCPAVTFPLSATVRDDLVRKGYQTAAGFIQTSPESNVVEAVEPGSAAERAGLKAGDVIVEVNGNEIKHGSDLDNALVYRWPRGAKDLSLKVKRDGEELQLETFRPRTLGVQPTQIYESVSMAFLLAVLLTFHPLRKSPGQVMAVMMIGYAVHRYFNELLRSDNRPVGFESYFSVLLLAGGVVMFVWLQLRPVKVEGPGEVKPAA